MDQERVEQETGEQHYSSLVESYRQMAADSEREMEAEEWTKQLLFELD